MSKQHTGRLHPGLVGFAGSAVIAFVMAGLAAWWAQSRDIVLPDGPVYQNGRIVGRALGVTSPGSGRVHFAEIADADALLDFGKFQYREFTLSISAILRVQHPESGGGARLLRVTAKADQK
jgi:hypothetical protein